MTPQLPAPRRPASLLRLAGDRLRHVAGCRACRDTYLLGRQEPLRNLV